MQLNVALREWFRIIFPKSNETNKIDNNGNGQCYPAMGCRSFLTPYLDENNQPKYYGRFNAGVITINLVDVAMSSKQDMETFWNLFENRLELCHRALQCRHERLRGTLSDVAPILWQHGALARLKKVKRLTNYCLVITQHCPLVMQDCMNVLSI